MERLTTGDVGLEEEILEMLMIDDESPWIIHEALARTPEIESLLRTLDRFRERGWVIAWLPAGSEPIDEHRAKALEEYRIHVRSRSQAPFQEFGPWYRITDAGRAEFERREAA